MHIENTKKIVECLAQRIREEFDKGIEHIDTCEMEKAIDMLKDSSEALYYNKVTHAMDKVGETIQYNPHLEPTRLTRDILSTKSMPNLLDNPSYSDGYQAGVRDSQPDYRTGHSGDKRMTFMVSKQIHDGNTSDDIAKNTQLLDEYLEALWEDMEELTQIMTPNEKAVLKSKMNTMISKIV